MNGLIELDERLQRLRDDADRIARCLEIGELTVPALDSSLPRCAGGDPQSATAWPDLQGL